VCNSDFGCIVTVGVFISLHTPASKDHSQFQKKEVEYKSMCLGLGVGFFWLVLCELNCG